MVVRVGSPRSADCGAAAAATAHVSSGINWQWIIVTCTIIGAHDGGYYRTAIVRFPEKSPKEDVLR